MRAMQKMRQTDRKRCLQRLQQKGRPIHLQAGKEEIDFHAVVIFLFDSFSSGRVAVF